MLNCILLPALFLAILTLQCESAAAADSNTGPGLYKNGQKILDLQEAIATPEQSLKAYSKATKGQEFRRLVLGDRASFDTKETDPYLLLLKEYQRLVQDSSRDQSERIERLSSLAERLSKAADDRSTRLEQVESDLRQSGNSPEKFERHSKVLRAHRESSGRLLSLLADLRDAAKTGNQALISSGFENLRRHLENNLVPVRPQLRSKEPCPALIDVQEAQIIERDSVEPDSVAIYPTSEELDRARSQGDLDPTIDVQFTDDIIAMADSLGHSPARMFNFVRENCEFEPYLGSRKGSQQTLHHRQGNDYDQASLLIALLRVSGFHARYAKGVVEMSVAQATNWLGIDDPQTAANLLATAGFESMIYRVGGVPVAIRCRRVWVEAYLPFNNFRGAINDSTGFMWVPLDPAFKQHSYDQGINLLSEINFNAESFVRDYYLNGFQATTPLEDLKQVLTDSLAVYHPGATFDDLITKRTLIEDLDGFLPGTLPYTLITKESDFTEIPSNKRYSIRFYLSGSDIELDYTTSLPQIAEKQVTVSYVGATAADQQIIDTAGGIFNVDLPYLVDLKPVLKIDGCEVARGTGSIMMGTQHYSDIYFFPPTGAPNTIPLVLNSIIAGNYQGIGIDPEDAIPAFFGSPQTTCDEGYLGQELHQTALYYLNTVDIAGDEISRLLHQVVTNDVSEAIVENTIGVDLDSLGYPVSFEWTGLAVDADRKIMGPFSVDGSDRRCAYMRVAGADGSIRENRVFEERFEEEAVSTMKILELAADSGIAICEITSSISADCPDLVQDPVVIDAINAALASGHHVIIPKTELTYYDWTGTGFIDLNPSTCAAGYMISGEHNISGGSTVVQGWHYPIQNVRCMAPVGPITVTPVSATGLYCAESEQTLTFAANVTYKGANCEDLLAEYTQFPMRYSIKYIADTWGAGVYTFKIGTNDQSCGCNSIEKSVTIVKIRFPAIDVAVGKGKTRPITVDIEPASASQNVSFGSTIPQIGEISGSQLNLIFRGLSPGWIEIVALLDGDTCCRKAAAVFELRSETIADCPGSNSDRLTLGIGERVNVYTYPVVNVTRWQVSAPGKVESMSGPSTVLETALTPSVATVTAFMPGTSLDLQFNVIGPTGIEYGDETGLLFPFTQMELAGVINPNMCIGGGLSFVIQILPTSVSFERVNFRENKVPEPWIWPCGFVEPSYTSENPSFSVKVRDGRVNAAFDRVNSDWHCYCLLYDGSGFQPCTRVQGVALEYKNDLGVWTEFVQGAHNTHTYSFLSTGVLIIKLYVYSSDTETSTSPIGPWNCEDFQQCPIGQPECLY